MASTLGGGTGRSAALSLYRSILRAHSQYLPLKMRQLGDAYVKSEFRQHKAVTETAQLEQFFTEWRSYLNQIQQAGRARATLSSGALDGNRKVGGGGGDTPSSSSSSAFRFGKDISIDELNDEQKMRLEKLREESIKGGRGGAGTS